MLVRKVLESFVTLQQTFNHNNYILLPIEQLTIITTCQYPQIVRNPDLPEEWLCNRMCHQITGRHRWTQSNNIIKSSMHEQKT